MPAMRTHLAVLFLSTVTAPQAAAAVSPCNQVSPCECHFPDGSTLNLLNLFAANGNSTPYLHAVKSNITSFYHGCVDYKFDLVYENINEEKCRKAAVMCTFNATLRDIKTVAVASEGRFQMHKMGHIALQYVHANASVVNVVLICTPDLSESILSIEDISSQGNEMDLHLYSRHACRIPGPGPVFLSIGTKLLIIATTCSLMYLVGGICFAKYARGAQGQELLPNVDFWRGLPSLVRDGVLFVVGGCSPHLVLSTATYNQI